MTERPDVACSYLLEGAVRGENEPGGPDPAPDQVGIKEQGFHKTVSGTSRESPEDYYKSPLVGSYFRLVRFGCILVRWDRAS